MGQTPAYRSRSSQRRHTPHRRRIALLQSRRGRSRSAVPRRSLRSRTPACTELQSAAVIHTEPKGRRSARQRQMGVYLAGRFRRGSLGRSDTHPEPHTHPCWSRPAGRRLEGQTHGMTQESKDTRVFACTCQAVRANVACFTATRVGRRARHVSAARTPAHSCENRKFP